jgi:hypothetical protein
MMGFVWFDPPHETFHPLDMRLSILGYDLCHGRW